MTIGSVVVSDPDSTATATLRSRLINEDYSVYCVGKACEAISLIQDKAIDVLIMDSDCNDLPCEEAVSIIKGIDENLAIIITARENSVELERRIRNMNVFYYHIKGFGVSELELAVKNALERRKKAP